MAVKGNVIEARNNGGIVIRRIQEKIERCRVVCEDTDHGGKISFRRRSDCMAVKGNVIEARNNGGIVIRRIQEKIERCPVVCEDTIAVNLRI